MSSKLPPGEETDDLVAKEVMGWKKVQLYSPEEVAAGLSCLIWEESGHGVLGFHPSTDIAHAFEVVEAIGGRPWSFCDLGMDPDSMNPDGDYFCTFPVQNAEGMMEMMTTKPITVWAETMPLAICLAALKAVGHDFGQPKGPSDASD